MKSDKNRIYFKKVTTFYDFCCFTLIVRFSQQKKFHTGIIVRFHFFVVQITYETAFSFSV